MDPIRAKNDFRGIVKKKRKMSEKSQDDVEGKSPILIEMQFFFLQLYQSQLETDNMNFFKWNPVN